MIRDFAIAESPSLRARADAWLSAPEAAEPVVPKRAATVMFVRDAEPSGGPADQPTGESGGGSGVESGGEFDGGSGGSGVEVFMLRRVATMAFAPRMMVFPGGGVDPRDADAELPWAGPTPADWAMRLEVDEATARVLVAAAVREVFEECGVLLAGPAPDEVIADVGSGHWHERRRRLLQREASLSEVLREHDLLLRSDLLGYRAHWITPEFEARRYDTRFFSAAVPQGQRADDDTTEADVADWVRPADLLRAWRDGAALMLPPTVVAVEEVAAATSAAAFIAEQPVVAPVQPELVDTGDGLVLRADLPR